MIDFDPGTCANCDEHKSTCTCDGGPVVHPWAADLADEAVRAVAEPWGFGGESAALLIARAAWPFDTQVAEWAPRMLTDRDLFDRTRAEAEARITSATAHVMAAHARSGS